MIGTPPPTGELFARGNDVGMFEVAGGRLNQDEFDRLLAWSVINKVSDLSLQAGECAWADIGGRLRRVTPKKLTQPEVAEVVRSTYGDNGPGLCNAGNDLDYAYDTKVPEDYLEAVGSKRMRFRVNVTCGRIVGGRGFQITLRTLPNQPRRIEDLGIEPEILQYLRPPQGMNLVTGPTGSGKSTLLSSLVRWRGEQEDANEKFLEYSRPIEYVYDGLNFPSSFVHQAEAGDHLRPRGDNGTDERGVWAYCGRNALRRKPTFIVVGEARDAATIAACIELSQTGHLVMSTMHTIGVPETIRRAVLVFPGAERASLSVDLLNSLNLVVTQLLIPRIGGGVVAVREFMLFNEPVRRELSQVDPDRLPFVIRQMLQERRVIGQGMDQGARKLLEAGKITEDTFHWIAARTMRDGQVGGTDTHAAATTD